MIERLKNIENWPLIVILAIVIIIAIVLSIMKFQSTKEANANTNVSEVTNQESQDENKEDGEDSLVTIVNVQEVVDETEKEEENVDAKYFIRVNYGQNVVTIYTKDSKGEYTVPYKAMVCSTGTATPRSGTYTIPSGDYSRGTWGMMVGGVWAQYYTRIHKSILFHSVPYTDRNKWSLEYWEYDKLGTAASAGCIRLTVENAKWIYNNCPAGTKVEFYTDSNPGPLVPQTPQKISEHEEVRGWDPTDPDSTNPWKTYTPAQDEEETQEKTEENTQPTTKPATKPTTKPSTSVTPDETPDEEIQNPEVDNTTGGETTEPNEGTGTEETPNPDESKEPEETPGEEIPTPGEGDTTEGETPNPDEGGTSEEENPTPDEGGTSEVIPDTNQGEDLQQTQPTEQEIV